MTDLATPGVRIIDERAIRCVPGSAEQAIRDTARVLQPISLEDLVETADLQTRVDRKYFVPAATFRALMVELNTFTVLEIGGKRTFDYESVYFDTPDVLTYRAHLQGRRRRFKARTRSYLDNGLCMFEVKTVTSRGATVKDRIVHQMECRSSLTGDAHAFLAEILDRSYGHRVPPGMCAMLTSRYRRTTFASPDQGSRLTCDVALFCHDERTGIRARDNHVLVESKSADGAGPADRALRRLGVRPTSVSKYCVGIAALNPGVPSNPWRPTLKRYFDLPATWVPDLDVVAPSTTSDQVEVAA